MEYHKQRFKDHSLLIYYKEKLTAIFPANIVHNKVYSHSGLSYGGVIISNKTKQSQVNEILAAICLYFKAIDKNEIYYKCIPSIYHRYPSEEDKYALFKLNAQLYRRDVSTTIQLENMPGLSKGRKWLLARARKNHIEVSESDEFVEFIDLETSLLQTKYNAKPVHSAQELSLLKSLFPNNIKLYEARNFEGDLLAGIIIFVTATTIHAQYISSTLAGKELGAFELIFDSILKEYSSKKYFDFGISTENDGIYLNEGLLSYKESFGGRATVCDFYKIVL